MGSLAEPNFFFLSLFFFSSPPLHFLFFPSFFLFSSNFFLPFSCLPSFFISPIRSHPFLPYFFCFLFSSPFCCFSFSLSSLYFILLILPPFLLLCLSRVFFLSFSPLINCFTSLPRGLLLRKTKTKVVSNILPPPCPNACPPPHYSKEIQGRTLHYIVYGIFEYTYLVYAWILNNLEL